jgi:hypothetical protein
VKYTCFKLRRRIDDLIRWRIILTALFAAALGALLGQLGDAFKGELIYSQWKFDFLENWHNPCIIDPALGSLNLSVEAWSIVHG